MSITFIFMDIRYKQYKYLKNISPVREPKHKWVCSSIFISIPACLFPYLPSPVFSSSFIAIFIYSHFYLFHRFCSGLGGRRPFPINGIPLLSGWGQRSHISAIHLPLSRKFVGFCESRNPGISCWIWIWIWNHMGEWIQQLFQSFHHIYFLLDAEGHHGSVLQAR